MPCRRARLVSYQHLLDFSKPVSSDRATELSSKIPAQQGAHGEEGAPLKLGRAQLLGSEGVTEIQQQGNIYGEKMLTCACFPGWRWF